MPILSIITINRNNAEGLRKTIESVLTQDNQNPEDIEYIIIDGASTDNSVEVIKEFDNSTKYKNKITYWISEPDTGIYNAMNKGIKKARGEYCLFLNSGDWLNNAIALKTSLPYLDGTEIIVGEELFTDGRIIRGENKFTIFSYMDSFIPHNSTFIKTTTVQSGYLENYEIISDYVFFFEKLFFHNATYKTIPVLVTTFDLSGISAKNRELSKKELNIFYSSSLPKYVVDYYYYYISPLQREIRELGTFTKNNKLAYLIIRTIRKIKWTIKNVFEKN